MPWAIDPKENDNIYMLDPIWAPFQFRNWLSSSGTGTPVIPNWHCAMWGDQFWNRAPCSGTANLILNLSTTLNTWC